MLADILVLASVYVLIAAGFVIVYRTSHVLNFAHGEVFMVGGYLGFAIAVAFAVPPVYMLPIAIVVGLGIGLLIYFLLMAPMAGHSVFAAVLLTIALGMVIRGVALIVFDGQVVYPGRVLNVENTPFELFDGIEITVMELAIIVSAAAIMAGLMLFFRYSPWGIRMRAASQDPQLASWRGINIHLVFASSWAIATSIGIYASVLYSFNQQVSPSIADIALRALAVALVGGMDSMKGIVPAALAVAAVELLVLRYVSPQAAEVIPFVFLVLVLLVRPWGLFGTKELIDRI